MAALTVQSARTGNANVTLTAAAETGDTAVNPGADVGGWSLPMFLLVLNGSGVNSEITIDGGTPVDVLAGDYAVFPLRGGGVAGRTHTIAYENHEDVDVAVVTLW
jgi:hypothetical protein